MDKGFKFMTAEEYMSMANIPEIDRWDEYEHGPGMTKYDDGYYVRYDDYASIVMKLNKRISLLEERVITLQGHDNLKYIDKQCEM